MNLWFLVDVCLNFVTGYVDRKTGVLVMSKRRIAQRYLRTYFVLDIWCALPFDRLVLPALVEVAPPQKPLKCAGSGPGLLGRFGGDRPRDNRRSISSSLHTKNAQEAQHQSAASAPRRRAPSKRPNRRS